MVIFVTATNTNIGKTYASKLVVEFFLKKDKKVCYLKPIETGVDNIPKDANEIYSLIKSISKDYKLSLNDIVFYKFSLPAAPFVADKNSIIDIDFMVDKIKYIEKKFDIIIVEGAGGLKVPIKKDFFMIDFIKKIKPKKTLLITPSYLGCINETMLSIELLKKYKIDFDWVVNLYKQKEDFYTITFPFYKTYFKNVYFLQKDLDEIFSNCY